MWHWKSWTPVGITFPSNNFLSSGSEWMLMNCCSMNTIKSMVNLEKFVNLRMRNNVSNLTNPICMAGNYRQEVLKLLPNLEQLDGRLFLSINILWPLLPGEYLTGPHSSLFSKMRDLERALSGVLDLCNIIFCPYILNVSYQSRFYVVLMSGNNQSKRVRQCKHQL